MFFNGSAMINALYRTRPFYFHSESELELLIGENLAAAVIQNIRVVDLNSPSFQESKKTDVFLILFELSRKQTKMLCETFRLASPTAQRFWGIIGEDEQF